MDTTCLLVDASYAVKLRILTLPSQKMGGKTKKKTQKKAAHSHALFASTRDEYK